MIRRCRHVPEIELKSIRPSSLNPRVEFDGRGLEELARSIGEVGVIEPIVVRPAEDGFDHYEVVVGERRYRAAQRAGLETVPCIVREYSDDDVMRLNVIENVHRTDLSAVEKGKLCSQILEQFPDDYPNITALARKLGLGQSTVSAWLEAASMPPSIQALIAPETPRRVVPPGKIDYWTATAITRRVRQPGRAEYLVKKVASDRVPRRLALRAAKEIARNPGKPVAEIYRRVVRERPTVLPFSRVHADAILAHVKTQTARKSIPPDLRAGKTVRAAITHFADLKVVAIDRKRLGDFDEQDVKREGGYSLEEFKEVWTDLHGDWDPNETVYVIRFQLANPV
jgi:ParB/RepB/Spo0J family partition protein